MSKDGVVRTRNCVVPKKLNISSQKYGYRIADVFPQGGSNLRIRWFFMMVLMPGA